MTVHSLKPVLQLPRQHLKLPKRPPPHQWRDARLLTLTSLGVTSAGSPPAAALPVRLAQGQQKLSQWAGQGGQALALAALSRPGGS